MEVMPPAPAPETVPDPETDAALRALSALAQETRLQVFRLLVGLGPSGAAAGDIAQIVGVSPSTLSTHLGILERSGLVRSWRVQRHIYYAAHIDGTRRLLTFLTDDCCQGRPEICAGLAGPLKSSGSLRKPLRSNPMSTESPDRVYNVLFLCTGNSCRSVMAESILNRVGAGRFRGYSAGSHPAGAVNPRALELLKHLNYNTDGLRSKDWEEFSQPDSPPMDFVFTLCDRAAGEVCPVWPGQPMTAHWGFPDPAEAQGTEAEIAYEFADVYRQIETLLSIFVNLPIASLDRLKLQERLHEMAPTAKADA